MGFCCNWCSYAAADLAGTSRMQYPSNIRMIRVMCSGRVSELLIFKAFTSGADGVLVAGCHPGDCHYMKGNLGTMRKITAMKPFLGAIGVEPERLRLEWIGASEGPLYAETIRSFTQKIKELGPCPLNRRRRKLSIYPQS